MAGRPCGTSVLLVSLPNPAPHPTRVLIAGAGPAGLEAALAVRELAGDRVTITLLAPDDELVYRPLSVADPFSLAVTRRYPLDPIARDVGAERVVDRLASVDPVARVVRTEAGDELGFDALLIALGARAEATLEPATTFWGPGDAEAVHGLVQDVEDGYTRRVAFVVPPGTAWSLPLYELALLTAARAYDSNVTPELHLITSEDAPIAVFGTQASQSLVALLEEAGIELHTGVYAEPAGDGVVELRPTGRRVEVDRIVALPRLTGRAIDGVPADANGFIPVDEHARVRGLDDVWAAGDATDFPLKQGGLATQQADTAARSIAARAGAPVEPEPFRPLLRGILLTGRGAWWLRNDPAGGDGEGELAGHALWWPPSKIAGRWLSPYLAKRDEGSGGEPPRGTPLEIRLAHSQAAEGAHASSVRVVDVLTLERLFRARGAP
jgi:sulfide:quinone oxidoreductase